MMTGQLSKEVIRKIRELALCGKSKQCIAKELGIGLSTVYKFAKGIPSPKKEGQFSEELIQGIREEVLRGKSKYKIAKERGLKFGAVYYYTQDLPNHVYREEGLVGKTLDLLKELLKEGYVVSTRENTHQLRRLKRYLPMIQRSQIGGGAVYYLDDKNKIALKSIIQHRKSKIFCYQEIAEISNVFDVNLSKKEKLSLFGKKQSKTARKNRCSNSDSSSGDDAFRGRFLHSEVLIFYPKKYYF
jgi:hypothetical protein